MPVVLSQGPVNWSHLRDVTVFMGEVLDETSGLQNVNSNR